MSRSRFTSNFGDSLIFNEAPDIYDVFQAAPAARHVEDTPAADETARAAADQSASPITTLHVAEVIGAPIDIMPTHDAPTSNGAPPSTTTGSTTGAAADLPGSGTPTSSPSAPVGTNSGVNGGIFDANLHFYSEGTAGDDVLTGSHYADEIHGLGGNDLIQGGASSDILYGDEGNDTLEGGLGNDILEGGAGNDTLRGGQGADALIGGEGMDNVSYVLSSSGVIVDLATGGVTGDAAGDTYSGIENVFGTSYGDILSGDGQANVMHGGSGDDFVFGQGGDDRIFGDLGFDILRGGAGNDILNGGRDQDRLTGDDEGQFGYDTFVLQAGNGVDIITDFQQGYDHIDLRGYGITNVGSDGILPVGQTWGDLWFGGALNGGDRLVFDPYEHTLYQVNVAYDNDYGAWYVASRSEIAVLQGVDTLSASDLILS